MRINRSFPKRHRFDATRVISLFNHVAKPDFFFASICGVEMRTNQSWPSARGKTSCKKLRDTYNADPLFVRERKQNVDEWQIETWRLLSFSSLKTSSTIRHGARWC